MVLKFLAAFWEKIKIKFLLASFENPSNIALFRKFVPSFFDSENCSESRRSVYSTHLQKKNQKKILKRLSEQSLEKTSVYSSMWVLTGFIGEGGGTRVLWNLWPLLCNVAHI
jgi:hypothetical protein